MPTGNLGDRTTFPEVEKGTPIKVTWLDADCESGWLEANPEIEEDLPPEAYLESYGVFCSLGPKFLTISYSYNREAGDFLGKHRIPVGMVHTVEVLSVT